MSDDEPPYDEPLSRYIAEDWVPELMNGVQKGNRQSLSVYRAITEHGYNPFAPSKSKDRKEERTQTRST